MRKLIFASALLSAVGLSLSASAHDTEQQATSYIDKNTEAKLIKVCEALKSNSRLRLRLSIQEGGFNFKQIMDGLVCNGQDPVTFAMNEGAQNTARLMALKNNMPLDTYLAKR